MGTVGDVTNTEWLLQVPVTHRGWYTEDVDEHSATAFERSCAAGFAVELDVQLGEDELVVMHDPSTGRVCGDDVAVESLTTTARRRLRLVRGGEGVLTLDEALELVGGRVPVIVEMKDPVHKMGQYELVNRVARKVERYTRSGADAAVHSFDARLVHLMARRAPHLVRGQAAGATELAPLQRAAAETYVTAPVTQPAFIAHNVNRLPSMRVANLRNYGLPVLAWTVKTAADLENAALYADNVIVEGEALDLVAAAGGFAALRQPPPKLRERMRRRRDAARLEREVRGQDSGVPLRTERPW